MQNPQQQPLHNDFSTTDPCVCVCMQVSVCPWCVCIRHHVTECALKLGDHNDAIGIQPSRGTGISRRPVWTEPKPPSSMSRARGPRTRYPPKMKEAGTFCKIAQGVSPQQAIVQALKWRWHLSLQLLTLNQPRGAKRWRTGGPLPRSPIHTPTALYCVALHAW